MTETDKLREEINGEGCQGCGTLENEFSVTGGAAARNDHGPIQWDTLLAGEAVFPRTWTGLSLRSHFQIKQHLLHKCQLLFL